MGTNSLPKTVTRQHGDWFEPRPYCAWVQHANHSVTEPPTIYTRRRWEGNNDWCGSCCMELYINMYILYINKCWWWEETGVLIWVKSYTRKQTITALQLFSQNINAAESTNSLSCKKITHQNISTNSIFQLTAFSVIFPFACFHTKLVTHEQKVVAGLVTWQMSAFLTKS